MVRLVYLVVLTVLMGMAACSSQNKLVRTEEGLRTSCKGRSEAGAISNFDLDLTGYEAVYLSGMIASETKSTLDLLRPRLARCFEGQRTKPGKLILEWDVDKDGRSLDIHAVYNDFGAQISKCVEGVVQNAKFGRPKSGQIGRIRFPFALCRNDG